ncbi:MAG: hypothetical protein HZB85_09130 [Deltaproteobacteria bacterium]|nr:hypothetical protein [Deltaproteobacteria bacterium]
MTMNNNHENDVLIRALEADAVAQSKGIIRAAEDAAAEMLRQAHAEAEAFEAERVGALQAGLERERGVRLSNARLLARAVCLKARQEAVEAVLEAACSCLCALPSSEHARLIRGLYDGLKAEWPFDEPPVVLVNPRDVALLRDYGVDARPDETVIVGVIFVAQDGKVRYVNTVASRLKMMRSGLVPMIDAALFSDAEQEG